MAVAFDRPVETLQRVERSSRPDLSRRPRAAMAAVAWLPAVAVALALALVAVGAIGGAAFEADPRALAVASLAVSLCVALVVAIGHRPRARQAA